jgi:2-polyprenyl-6-methoxyphenol hydroxylase-like FAD-dependent oxidoreductase
MRTLQFKQLEKLFKTDTTSFFGQYGKDLTDVAFTKSKNGVIALFSDSIIVHGSIVLGADGPRSKVREFAMSRKERAQVSKFPICHHNMTVCYGDVDKARYLRQQFPTSYLALSQRSFYAFQSSK